MAIAFSCEHCGKRFEVDDTLAGRRCRCQQCGNVFPIPAAGYGLAAEPRRRVVAEATLDDDDMPPPLPRAGVGRLKGEERPSKKSGGGLLVPMIIIGVLGSLVLVILVGAALLLPAIQAARQAAERARAKAEARAVAARQLPARAAQKVALNNAPANPAPKPEPTPAPAPTPAEPVDELEDDAYRQNDQLRGVALNKLRELGNLLAQIRDQRSAQQVQARIQAIGKELEALKPQSDALPPLTEEQENKLDKKYEPLLQAALNRIASESNRLQSVAGTPRFQGPTVTSRFGRRPSIASRTRPGLPARPGMPTATRPGLAAPMDPNTTVTLVVSNVNDNGTRNAVGQKVQQIMSGLAPTSRRRTRNSGTTMTIMVSPVSDPKALADRIDFGQVTRIDGRTIEVACTLSGSAEPQAEAGDAIGQALADLKSPEVSKRKRAMVRLRQIPVDQARRAEVASAIAPMLQDQDGFARGDAAKALAVWGGPESIQPLIDALKDTEFGVRWAVLDALKNLKAPQAAPALAQMVAENKDRGKAVDALQAAGPLAEDAVIPLLSHGDDRVRGEACKILQVIGTESSVPMLRRLAMSNAGSSSRDAVKALEAMRLRGVNINVTARKKRR